MRLVLPSPRRPKLSERILGNFTRYRTARYTHRLPRPALNRYPGEIIGVSVSWRWHTFSWVAPVWLAVREAEF